MSRTPSTSRLSLNERALARVGTTVQKYVITRLLGIGGMAVVYAATHRNGHHVAMKILQERFLDDPDAQHLLSREAYMANQVGHPGAVPVLDDDVDDTGCPFLVMPLLEGESVRVRWQRTNLRLPAPEVVVLASDVLDVLASAHAKGIVHRDIKPDNLFLTREGKVKVLDFGIARRMTMDAHGTITGRIIGTPAFMPPEQARGDRAAIGPHSDIWAVGATLFTLLSGEFVHNEQSAGAHLIAAGTRPSRSLAEVAPQMASSVVRAVDKALAFEPLERWQSARAMRDALTDAFQEALGESIVSVFDVVRTNITGELSQEAAETDVSGAPCRPAQDPPVVGIDVRATLREISDSFRIIPVIAHRILVKHGLGRFEADGRFTFDRRNWWPMGAYAAILHEISEAVGPAKTVEIGKLIAKHALVPPTMRDLRSSLSSMDVAYHLNHRLNGQVMFDVKTGRMLEGIGHRRFLGDIGENRIAMEFDGPYPCDLSRGILFGFARRFEPHAFVEHVPDACRKNGAASCIYHVTW